MKRRKLRAWVKVVVVIILIIILSAIQWHLMEETENEITNCTEEGYTRSYCIQKLK